MREVRFLTLPAVNRAPSLGIPENNETSNNRTARIDTNISSQIVSTDSEMY
jgi:hypothetical protein